jgi:hypothetical protein
MNRSLSLEWLVGKADIERAALSCSCIPILSLTAPRVPCLQLRFCYLFSVKTALYGRIVFGASAMLFGVIALMWHDADTWQNLQHIWSLPFGTLIGGV